MKSFLGYTAAVLTILAAVLTPFLLFGLFTRLAAAAGLRIDPSYVPTEIRTTLAHDGYFVTLYKPVYRRGLLPATGSFATGSFVQVKWTPVNKLPANVSEALDLNGDGNPDVEVMFAVPRDPHAPLRFDARPIGSFCQEVKGGGKDNFYRLIARIDNSIVVRIPLR